MPNVTTIRGPVRVEIERVKGSRFVAELWPVSDEEAATAMVTELRRRDPDATHHCWAVRLADGVARSSDDGEPRDTAGAPILRHLAGADLQDVACVVTRWFGGTKLGRGGLIRAYGDAAAAAIAAAEVIERPVMRVFDLVHDYDLSGPVQGVLSSHDVEVVESDYADVVRLRVAVVAESAEALQADLADATAGRVVAVSTGASGGGGPLSGSRGRAVEVDEEGL